MSVAIPFYGGSSGGGSDYEELDVSQYYERTSGLFINGYLYARLFRYGRISVISLCINGNINTITNRFKIVNQVYGCFDSIDSDICKKLTAVAKEEQHSTGSGISTAYYSSMIGSSSNRMIHSTVSGNNEYVVYNQPSETEITIDGSQHFYTNAYSPCIYIDMIKYQTESSGLYLNETMNVMFINRYDG